MKNLRILAALVLLVCLTACGTTQEPAPEQEEPTVQVEAPIQEEETPAQPEEEPIVEEPANTQYEQAVSLIDSSVEELYDTVGYPIDYMYADSCLGEGEDGELYFDGFTVYTYRDLEDNETIYDVMENEIPVLPQ